MSKQSNVRKMRVSFDLDEVLFVSPKTHKTEPPPRFPFNRIYQERLRLGTPDLIHRLQSLGYDVLMYGSTPPPSDPRNTSADCSSTMACILTELSTVTDTSQRFSGTAVPYCPRKCLPGIRFPCTWMTKPSLHPGAVSSGFRHTFWTPRMITGRKRSLHGQTKSGRRRPGRPGHEPAATGN